MTHLVGETIEMIYRVDLSTLTVRVEDVPQAWQGLGGRALTSAIVAREVPPLCWPLGPENKLVLAPGLLGGTIASSSGRLSVGAKSPLTGTIKESNVGGSPASKLARLGVKALIIEGQAPKGRWHVLKVTKDGLALLDATDLKGLEVYETVARLLERHGKRVAILAVGPAGEMLLSAANIGVTDVDGVPARHAGRGGLGAVMGSKGLKAIVVDDAGAAHSALADADLFRQTVRRYAQALREHPTTGKSLPIYGTSILVSPINEMGGLPTRNFSVGAFEGVGGVSGEALHDLIVARGGKTTHHCMAGCAIRCSNVFLDEKGQERTRGFEYESIVLLGPNCGIGDLDALARLNRLCDEYGLDTMEMGVTLGVAMEANLAEFGDINGAMALLEEVGKGTPLGRILGHGAAVAGRVFSVARVPVVKGQAIAAYDPRALKGTGVTYATSPMGADHTAGNALPGTVLPGVGQPDPTQREHQIELSRYLQELATIFDSVGLCWFTRGPILADNSLLLDMLQGRLGGDLSMDALFEMARETLRRELAFNRAAGFGPQDDRLPEFFLREALPPRNLTFDISPEELRQTLEA
jgi:aldehyde:ferredoxin oxidoreductase